MGSNAQMQYKSTMQNNIISLCPRGSGIDSVRLLESCYFTRVPVLISDHDYYILGEETYDTSFCFRICKENMHPDFLRQELQKIYETPIEELRHRAIEARKYFEVVVREYFDDPTFFFIGWLLKNPEQRKMSVEK